MNIEYTYTKNTAIDNNIIRIETAKKIIEFLPQMPHIEELFRQKSLLKSSLFSAKIEGNSLRIEEIERRGNNTFRDKEKLEIVNILNSLKWIYSNKSPKRINTDTILKFHKKIMDDLSSDAGKLRTEPSAIFNQAGIAIYMTPPPSELSQLLRQLIKLSKQKEHPVITAAIIHFAFEKIHPFIDGNGRVGRLLCSFFLKNAGYNFRGLAVLEEYLNEHREEYYDVLTITTGNITEFIEFFTEVIAISAEKVIGQLQNQKEEKPEDTLLPRRQEILAIIREHDLVSFDFIKRRFVKIPESSLHYDLKMLLKAGFIKKLGSTRGALYKAK